MLLNITCKNCKSDIPMKMSILTRPEFIDKRGEFFNEECPSCYMTLEYHANDVVAYKSDTFKKVGTTIGISVMIITTVLFFIVGYIATIGVVLGGLIISGANGSTNTSDISIFNGYKISRINKDS